MSRNTKTITEINKIKMIVEKHDGINVSKVYFPHNTQVGLIDPSFHSDLTVTGEIKGAIQKLSDGITNYLQDEFKVSEIYFKE